MAQALQNQSSRALAHNKAASALIERTARLFRIRLSGQRVHVHEACNRNLRDCRFRAACYTDIQIAVANRTHCLTDRVRGSRTCADRTVALSLQTVRHGNMRSGHIADHHRDRKRRNTARTLFHHCLLAFLKNLHAADAGAEYHAGTQRVKAAFLEAGLCHCLLCRCNRKLAEAAHALCFLLININGRIKILDLSRYLHLEIFGIKCTQRSDAVFAFLNAFPKFLDIQTDRSYGTHTGNYYTFHPVFLLTSPDRRPQPVPDRSHTTRCPRREMLLHPQYPPACRSDRAESACLRLP